MTAAPLVSTFVALALIPVAFFFTHAYISGRRHLPYHRATGTIAVVWDLSLSIFYMLFRLSGGQVEGSTLDIRGALLAYFIAHGIVAVIVILLEIVMLLTGLLQWKRRSRVRLHGTISKYLMIVWFGAFLSGEIIYIVNYVL
jgi:uncharacterized membrane protein YozB (DUF420 family)